MLSGDQIRHKDNEFSITQDNNQINSPDNSESALEKTPRNNTQNILTPI